MDNSASAFARVRLCTLILYPAPIRFRAIGTPMIPEPIHPTRWLVIETSLLPCPVGHFERQLLLHLPGTLFYRIRVEKTAAIVHSIGIVNFGYR
jgi:hypothetical protein